MKEFGLTVLAGLVAFYAFDLLESMGATPSAFMEKRDAAAAGESA